MSELILRDYQDDLLNRARPSLQKNKRVLIQSPTGTGKTALTVFMMDTARARGKSSIFIVHQKELLEQTSGALWKQKLAHGMIASGKSKTPLPVQVASVQTLVNRTGDYKEPDLIIIDEAHRATASSYQKILEAWPNAFVLGLSATPQRTDKKGLDIIFNDMIKAPPIEWFIDQGYLCDYTLIAPPIGIEQETFKKKGNDFDQSEIERATDKPKITGDAINTYKQHAYGRRCVVMCCSVKHAQHVADQYNESGIPAACIEGSQTTQERNKIIEDFRSGDLMVITNVQLLIEGLDIPLISCVQWLRPTASIIVFMQGNGRGFRPKGEHADFDDLLIIDHVKNWERHGLPDQDREWTLEGEKTGNRKGDNEPNIMVRECKKCHKVGRKATATHCPYCGEPYEVRARNIEEEEGELVEIRKAEITLEKKKNRIEQGRAQTIEDLIKLGITRGIKKPAAWAAITLAGRKKQRPSSADFSEANKALIKIRSELK